MATTTDDGRALARQVSAFTLDDLFRRSARLYADRVAVVSADVELTYRRLDERSSGYLGDPQATADAFRGGCLDTGDVLARHDDGTYSYVDRLKYLIKTGGENVYPAEVERVLTSHPDVREACAISVPDVRWGEAVKAVVVTEPGRALTPDEIVAWCSTRLRGFKRPRYVQFLAYEDVPRSTTGKILRHELEALEVTADQRPS